MLLVLPRYEVGAVPNYKKYHIVLIIKEIVVPSDRQTFDLKCFMCFF